MSTTTAINSRTWRVRPRPPWASNVLADRGYFKGEEVLACEPLSVTPYVPKPLTSGSKAAGRFGKQDFVYIPEEDAYRCPADQRLTWRFTSAEKGMTLHSYWTSKCAECPLKTQCTTGKERRIKRWEHEAVIDVEVAAVGQDIERLDAHGGLGLTRHVRELIAVVADIGDVLGQAQGGRRIEGGLHIVE